MNMCKEERLMEAVELSQEARAFTTAAAALAERIRSLSAQHAYDLDAALQLVENGQLQVHTILPGEPQGFVGLPIEVGLYLTGNACGGLFPQAPASAK